MKIKFSNRGNTLITMLHGEIDHHWAEYIKEKIDSEIFKSRTRNLIVDFGNVSFMDSSGIGVLIGRYKNIKGINGSMIASSLNEQMSKIFDMSGLTKIIPVCENVDVAYSNI